jgi:hypothetical protein
MARRRKGLVELDVDERTVEMSDEALQCRKRGHFLQEDGMTRKRYQELMAEGLWEDRYSCACGRYREIVWVMRSGAVVSDKSGYRDKSYLLPKYSTGRLSRDAARVAWVARRMAQFA